jgi:hypothetical protein
VQTRWFFLTVLGLGTLPQLVAAQAQVAIPPAAAEAPPPVAAEPSHVPPPVAPEVTPAPVEDAAPPPPVPPGLYRTPPRRYHLASPQLHAIEPRRHGNADAPFSIAVGGSLLWRNDRAQEVLSSDEHLGAFELFASYDVWTPFRGAVLAVGASLRSEAARGESDYDLRSHSVQAELQARYGVTSWFWPHVRAAVGGVTTRFQQHDRAADLDFEDRSGSVVGTFGAGFTLRTPTRMFETHRGRLASLSLGLLVEGGYTVAPDADLTLEPTRGSELSRATFALGSVQRSAPYLRIMGVLRF